MTDLLKKARDYEAKAAAQIEPEERPAFHLTPYVGWMNDPNGFSRYGGKYHGIIFPAPSPATNPTTGSALSREARWSWTTGGI